MLRKALGCCLLLGASVAGAQQVPVRNPHGPLAQPCSDCHGTESWTPARISSAFNHGEAARFSLLGAHAAAACRACHLTLDFRGTARECVACHTDPHRGEVGTDCARCHTARSFLDRSTMKRAHQLTRFPLAGTHLTVDCEACHATSQGRPAFVAVSPECVACHLKNFQGAKDPDHVAGAYSTDCAQCHASITWLRTTFDHAATGFALTGAHVRIHCSQCHGPGTPQALPAACASCHQANYDQATNPNHVTAAFPTDCALCHSTSSWRGAQMANHDPQFFPIYSGRHQGTWSSCASCHVNPSDYRVYDCRSCHGRAHEGGNFPRLTCADAGCHQNGQSPG